MQTPTAKPIEPAPTNIERFAPPPATVPAQPQPTLPALDTPGRVDPYSLARFHGASTLDLSGKQQEILTAPLELDEVEFDPPTDPKARMNRDGTPVLYVTHALCRARLHEAFGPGRWAMVPVGDPAIADNLVIQTWDLYVMGCYVGRATGEMTYIANNPRMTKGDTLEGAKSNALTRICQKDLGVGLELFSRNRRAEIMDELREEGRIPTKGGVRKSVQAPQQEPQAPPVPNPWVGLVVAVPTKQAPEGQGTWKLWLARSADGIDFGTYSSTIGPTLVQAKDGKCLVRIAWKANKRGGREIVSVERVNEPEPPDLGPDFAEREPGAEG